jgi:hypothetical protein
MSHMSDTLDPEIATTSDLPVRLQPDLVLSKVLAELIESLRGELGEYGELLALFDQQQESVMRGRAEEVLVSVQAINEQSRAVEEARQYREVIQGKVAKVLRAQSYTRFAELIPILPEKYRPALSSLVRENNQLLVRVQQRVRQNQLLLSRSLEVMGEIETKLGNSSATASPTAVLQPLNG